MSVPDAVLGMLRAAVDPVHDGEVPKDASGQPVGDRYAVFYASPGERRHEDLGHTSDRHVHRWQVTSVGATREQAEWVAVRCRDALVDARPNAPGWVCSLIEHESSGPIRRDDDLPERALFLAVDTYSVTATR